MRLIYVFWALRAVFFDLRFWIGVALVGSIYLIYLENKSWDEFAQAMNCKVVSKESATVGFVSGGNGNSGTVYVPGKTGYQCDDGVTYWR